MNKQYLASSFRDPSGRLFFASGRIYREIYPNYQKNYELLLNSGLYQKLLDRQLIIAHQEITDQDLISEKAFKVIEPTLVPFISYPYEWSFSQLKDAALATLAIQKIALEHSLSLKDASAYNIQFFAGRPTLIDTLSFEEYPIDRPWVAYKQFCQHFLAPLILASFKDIRLIQLLRVFIDGIPINLAAKLLPTKTKFNLGALAHIHLHAQSQKMYEGKKIDKNRFKLSLAALMGIIESLESLIKSLSWQPRGTEWANYYSDTNYTTDSFKEKKQLVAKMIDQVKPEMVWDLGANDGTFSRIAATKNIPTIAFDIDPAAAEKNYLAAKKNRDQFMLPLVLDLTNPSTNLGWANRERDSLIKRGPTDLALGLALVHHLAISNNLPFNRIAEFFRAVCRELIIEFVPKDDSQVQRLLATREDIFADYHQEGFEREFSQYFKIEKTEKIADSKRIIYLMKSLL